MQQDDPDNEFSLNDRIFHKDFLADKKDNRSLWASQPIQFFMNKTLPKIDLAQNANMRQTTHQAMQNDKNPGQKRVSLMVFETDTSL